MVPQMPVNHSFRTEKMFLLLRNLIHGEPSTLYMLASFQLQEPLEFFKAGEWPVNKCYCKNVN